MNHETQAISKPLPRVIGFWGATGVMLGIIIGSGIFANPHTVADVSAGLWPMLGLWALGGLISLCGAFTYAELATAMPQAGGVYVFLREGYGRAGRCMAFVFGWTYMLISKPFAAAAIALVFGEHLCPLLGLEHTTTNAKLLTSGALVLLTFVNVIGVRLGSSLSGALTLFKLGALVAIIIGAFLSPPAVEPSGVSHALSIPLWKALVIGMTAVLWTYDGWSDVGALAGEIRNPKRLLPITYLFGTLLITGLYVAINAAYVRALGFDGVRGATNLAPAVAEVLLPAGAGIVVSLVVVISTFGSTHGSIMTGARISYAQARDGLLFRFLGRVHPRFETPDTSLWIQLAMSLIALWGLSDFSEMAGGFVFTMWIFYGLAGTAIFTLRLRRPDLERPFRCPLYPVVPGLFVLAASGMTVLSVMDNPRANLMWIGVLLAGIPVYFVWNKLGTKPLPGETRPPR